MDTAFGSVEGPVAVDVVSLHLLEEAVEAQVSAVGARMRDRLDQERRRLDQDLAALASGLRVLVSTHFKQPPVPHGPEAALDGMQPGVVPHMAPLAHVVYKESGPMAQAALAEIPAELQALASISTREAAPRRRSGAEVTTNGAPQAKAPVGHSEASTTCKSPVSSPREEAAAAKGPVSGTPSAQPPEGVLRRARSIRLWHAAVAKTKKPRRLNLAEHYAVSSGVPILQVGTKDDDVEVKEKKRRGSFAGVEVVPTASQGDDEAVSWKLLETMVVSNDDLESTIAPEGGGKRKSEKKGPKSQLAPRESSGGQRKKSTMYWKQLRETIAAPQVRAESPDDDDDDDEPVSPRLNSLASSVMSFLRRKVFLSRFTEKKVEPAPLPLKRRKKSSSEFKGRPPKDKTERRFSGEVDMAIAGRLPSSATPIQLLPSSASERYAQPKPDASSEPTVSPMLGDTASEIGGGRERTATASDPDRPGQNGESDRAENSREQEEGASDPEDGLPPDDEDPAETTSSELEDDVDDLEEEGGGEDPTAEEAQSASGEGGAEDEDQWPSYPATGPRPRLSDVLKRTGGKGHGQAEQVQKVGSAVWSTVKSGLALAGLNKRREGSKVPGNGDNVRDEGKPRKNHRAQRKASTQRKHEIFELLQQVREQQVGMGKESMKDRARRWGSRMMSVPDLNETVQRLGLANVNTNTDSFWALLQYNTEKLARLNKKALGMLPLQPNGTYRSRWDVFILLVIVYSAYQLPYRMVLSQVNEVTDVLEVIDWIVVGVFSLDIVTNFVTAYEVSNRGESYTITSYRLIAGRYLQTWFVLDLLATIPLDYFLSGLKFFQLGKVLRMFRLLRLIKVSQQLENVMNPTFVRLLKLLMAMTLISHWSSCAAISVATSTTEPDLWLGVEAFLEQENMFQYGRALLWTFTTMLGSDSKPQDSVQVFFTIGVLVMGIVVLSSVFGSLVTLLNNMDAASIEYRDMMDKTLTYLRKLDVPNSLRERILNHHQQIYERTNGVDVSAFMESLPRHLKQEVAIFLNGGVLESMDIFNDCTINFLTAILMQVKLNIFLEGDLIFCEGDVGDEMYFIINGQVAVWQNGVFLRKLEPGDFFGTAILKDSHQMGTNVRTASVRATKCCTLYSLNGYHFKQIARAYPTDSEIFKKQALLFYHDHAEESFKETGSGYDIEATPQPSPVRTHSLPGTSSAGMFADSSPGSRERGGSYSPILEEE